MATRRYFQTPEKWTPDREEAYDFGFISKAMRIASKLGIPNLELELSLDGPEQVNGTSFGHFLHRLSHPGRHRPAGATA